MKIFITVKPNSKEESVEKIDEAHFLVRVKEPPVEDRANRGVIRLLTEYFDVPKSGIEIIKGHKSRRKIIVIQH